MDKLNCVLAVIVVLNIVKFATSQNNKCYHYGCYTSRGLSTNQISSNLRLGENDFSENVLRVLSWDLKNIDNDRDWNTNKIKLCDYLKSLKLSVIGFQNVNKEKLAILKKCLRLYRFTGSTNENADNNQNIIAYKRQRTTRNRKNGKFWLSKTPETKSKLAGSRQFNTCTWSRMILATVVGKRKIRSERVKSKVLRLMSLLVKKPKRQREEVYRTVNSYRWFQYYVVNTALDENDPQVASQQMKICLDYLYNKVMDRRRYPVMLFVSSNHDDSSDVYKSMVNHRALSLETSFKSSNRIFPKPTSMSNENVPILSDYVMKNGFQSVLSGTMTDSTFERSSESIKRPVFAALLPNIKGRRN